MPAGLHSPRSALPPPSACCHPLCTPWPAGNQWGDNPGHPSAWTLLPPGNTPAQPLCRITAPGAHLPHAPCAAAGEGMEMGMFLGSQRGGRGTEAGGVERDAGLGQGWAWCHHWVCLLCTLPRMCARRQHARELLAAPRPITALRFWS